MKPTLLSAILLFIILPFQGWSEETPPDLTLTEAGKYDLSLFLEVLEDPSGNLTIDDIRSPGYRDSFVSYEGRHPNLGMRNHPVWVRFSVANPGEDRDLYISYNYSLTDYVDYYEIIPGGRVRRLSGTEGGKSLETSFPYRRIVFDTAIPSGSTREYYLRVLSPRSAITVIMTLWDLKSFMEYERKALPIIGIVFGAALCISFYFFGMSFKLKEPAQFWFAMYLITLGIHVLLRAGVFQNLLPALPIFWYNIIHIFSIGFSFFSSIRFFRLFLELGRHARVLNRYLKVMEWAALAFIPLSFGPLVAAGLIGLLVNGITPIVTTVAAFYFWRKGVADAKYFAIGWLATNAACVIEFIRIIGVLPWYFWMYGALSTAVYWSIIFYTIAISNRIYHYKYFSEQDSLTGLANRHAMQRFLNTEWHRNLRTRRPLSILMIDVDRFKAFNDSQGHQKGDECLKKIVEVLENYATRPGDMAGRYGGEEFIIVLSETDADGAFMVAEKIRSSIEELGIPRKDDYGPGVTVSIGTATIVPSHDKSPSWLIDQADRALYQAKNTGRNKVCRQQLYNSLSSKKL